VAARREMSMYSSVREIMMFCCRPLLTVTIEGRKVQVEDDRQWTADYVAPRRKYCSSTEQCVRPNCV